MFLINWGPSFVNPERKSQFPPLSMSTDFMRLFYSFVKRSRGTRVGRGAAPLWTAALELGWGLGERLPAPAPWCCSGDGDGEVFSAIAPFGAWCGTGTAHTATCCCWPVDKLPLSCIFLGCSLHATLAFTSRWWYPGHLWQDGQLLPAPHCTQALSRSCWFGVDVSKPRCQQTKNPFWMHVLVQKVCSLLKTSLGFLWLYFPICFLSLSLIHKECFK